MIFWDIGNNCNLIQKCVVSIGDKVMGTVDRVINTATELIATANNTIIYCLYYK